MGRKKKKIPKYREIHEKETRAAESRGIDKEGAMCYPYKGLLWGFILWQPVSYHSSRRIKIEK